jgi:hypothetical protein
MQNYLEPQVLRPFHRAEVLSIAEAAAIAGRAVRTLREWCFCHDIGRRIGGRWAVSKIALTMWLHILQLPLMGVPSPSLFPPKEPKEAPSPPSGLLFLRNK